MCLNLILVVDLWRKWVFFFFFIAFTLAVEVRTWCRFDNFEKLSILREFSKNTGGCQKKRSLHVKGGFSNIKNLKLLCLGTFRSAVWYQCEKVLPQLLCTISVFR